MGSKQAEAAEHCRTAERLLKTSMLRWKADFDAAADEYSHAAQCYRVAREPQLSKQCHMKASENYAKTRAFFHAAKSLENAIIVVKKTEKPEEIVRLATESANFYQQHGSGDSAAAVLDKAAKILEEHHPHLAFGLFQRAADVSATESSQHQGSEYISKASRILVKLQRYDQALDSLRREIGFHQEANNTGAIGRLTVAMVLVQLARGDTVAAEKAYKEWGSNCEMAEVQTLEQLLQAYDEEDRASAKRALSSPFIRNMDVEYARLAASVPLPEGFDPAPRAAVRENAAPSYVSPNAQGTAVTSVTTAFMEQQAAAEAVGSPRAGHRPSTPGPSTPAVLTPEEASPAQPSSDPDPAEAPAPIPALSRAMAAMELAEDEELC